jgi:hypothetical protein
LVGSATEETVLELARRHPDSPVPRTAEGLREFYEFRDFPHFIDVYAAVNGLITEQEDLADLVRPHAVRGGARRASAAAHARRGTERDAEQR